MQHFTYPLGEARRRITIYNPKDFTYAENISKLNRTIKRRGLQAIENDIVERFNEWYSRNTEDGAKTNELPILNDLHEILPDKTGWTMALFGASKSGKTTLLRDFIKSDGNNIISLFSATLSSGAYNDIIDECDFTGFIYPERKVGKKRLNLVDAAKNFNERESNGNISEMQPFTFIFDDVIGESKNNESLLQSFLVYRNYKINTVISLQDTTLLRRSSRKNVNVIVVLRHNQHDSWRQTIEEFLEPMFTKYFPEVKLMNEKIAICRGLTDNYGKIVYDQTNDQVYWMKGCV